MAILYASAVLLIIFVILTIIITQSGRQKGKCKLPPGPTPLPILGNILQLNGKDVFKCLYEFSNKYGPVYTIHIGMEPVIVLSTYDVLKEALHDYGEVFGDRGYMPVLERINPKGIVASNGEHWKKLKRFCLMTLKNFGLGKRSIEQRIQDEAQFLIAELRKTKGQAVDPTLYLCNAVANVICLVVFGERFSYKNKEFIHLLGILNDGMEFYSSIWGQLYNMFPNIMSKLPGHHNRFMKSFGEVLEYIAEKIKIHEETLDPSSPRDLIDCFLIKINEEKDNPQSVFHIKTATNTIFDFLDVGTETISITLRFSLLILLKHPDVAERIRKEIDLVIGRNRPPCIEDRSNMAYTEAVIHEIQRFINITPLGFPHKVSQDINFRGFVLPKDITVYFMLGSALKDPKHFKYPDLFYPEHFLDENGKFCKNEAFMPFSSGKRMCPGEGLARLELFLFLTNILQNFTLRSLVDKEDLSITAETSWFGSVPHPYQLCFIPR